MNKTTVSTRIIGLTKMTDIEVKYSSPRVQGRVIFGGLVPFDRIWRTGANANTTITFSEDVKIDGKLLPKGSYALMTVPRPDQWLIIFYKEITNYGLPRTFDENRVALMTSVRPEAVSRPFESLSIMINQYQRFSASLEIAWDQTMVNLEIDLLWDRELPEGEEPRIGGGTASDFYVAAQFYFEVVKDYPAALMRIDMALQMNENRPYFYHRLKALIDAKMGNMASAIENAELSIEKAIQEGNELYVDLNRQSLEQWRK